MKAWFARLHRWVGLLIAVQFVLWLASGLVMSFLDHDAVSGHRHAAAPVDAPDRWPGAVLSPAEVAVRAGEPVESVERAWLLGRPVYRVRTPGSVFLVDALSGGRMAIGAEAATRLAQADYTGPGTADVPRLLAEAPLEARGHPGPIWRIEFDDPETTTLYLSARDGAVLERRTDTWRLFDIAWMLHIMDYTGRSDFNHPLVVTAAAAGTWMALSGLWLLGWSTRAGGLRPAFTRPSVRVSLTAPGDDAALEISARKGQSVLEALAHAGLPLPSQCGGGQTCGLCVVRVTGDAPAPTEADRALLTEQQLLLGDRLGCNLKVAPGMSLEVADAASLGTVHEAIVERVEAIGPFLREIVLRPEQPDLQFHAGAYVLVDIPAYRLCRDALVGRSHPLPKSALSVMPTVLESPTPVRRAYSPTLPPQLAGGRVPLLVRLDVDPARRPTVGRGSGYLFALQPGDRVRLAGPFGTFRLQPGSREKIFIGGGAGMAPLRAMIRERLHGGGGERMHFWYGTRTPTEAPYVAELTALQQAHPNFSFHLVYSQADNGALGPLWVHEAVHDGLLRAHGALRECEFYLCGPPAMLSATWQLLQDIGIPPNRIAIDDFKC